jgi:tetratricopeptide (TPR) repeat protein
VKHKSNRHDISVRKLQSLLGVSRSVLAGLIDSGFVTPARGPRNELRFTFQDVVLLRTAFQLQSARISSRKILAALARLRAQLPDQIPLSGIRVSAVGNTIMVRTGPSQWDANTGQLAFDFEVADIKGDVVFLDASSAKKDARKQADDWYALADQLAADADASGAEQAYRKALAIAPAPFYGAYVDLGVLLCEDDARYQDALSVFDEALAHFPEDAVLHFNRAVALELLGQLMEAEQSYARCLEIDPGYADAHHNLALIKEQLGDQQGLVRHMSAYRKLSS